MRIIFALALLTVSGAAQAADMPVKAQPLPVAAPSWTGWYVGLNGGGAWGTTDPTVTNLGPDSFFAVANVPPVLAAGSQSFNSSGGVVGGQFGYLAQTGRAVWGLEAGFDWMNLRGSRSTPFAAYATNAFGYTWNESSKSDFLFTLTGRVGPDLGGWYPYITGGLAVASIKYSATYTDTFYPANNAATASGGTNAFNQTRAGYAVGGGAEWRVAPHWLVRGEYLFMDFGSISGTGLIACSGGVTVCAGAGTARTTFSYSERFRENLGRVAVSYQF
jgi:outer membrane immunogenic protein